MLPSPLGEQGKSTRIAPLHLDKERGSRFPSPLGEQGKSTRYDVAFSSGKTVSVPSRGTGKINYENHERSNRGNVQFPSPLGEQGKSTVKMHMNLETDSFSFRPLSGNRENQPHQSDVYAPTVRTFPSPLGEQGKSTDSCVDVVIDDDDGFRPLSGNRENQPRPAEKLTSNELTCFRPLSGNRENQPTYTNTLVYDTETASFRPLSGNRENQLKERADQQPIRCVSVPSRGTGKINPIYDPVGIGLQSFRPLSGNRENQLSESEGKVVSVP